jgi:hypothetical protein
MSNRRLHAGGPESVPTRLRALCLPFPENSETASRRHPSFRAGRRVFAACGGTEPPAA